MKKSTMIVLGLSVCTAALFAGTPEAVFTRFIDNFQKVQPEAFTCEMSGRSVEESLQRVPADAVSAGKKPRVIVYNKRGSGQVIKVSNVEDVFENMFSEYNRLIAFTGAYILDRGRTWQEFSRGYAMTIVSQTASHYEVRIGARDDQDQTYGVFRINKSTLLIDGAAFYRGTDILYRVQNTYQRSGTFVLPARLQISRFAASGGDAREYDIRFSNYAINPAISPAIFRD